MSRHGSAFLGAVFYPFGYPPHPNPPEPAPLRSRRLSRDGL